MFPGSFLPAELVPHQLAFPKSALLPFGIILAALLIILCPNAMPVALVANSYYICGFSFPFSFFCFLNK
jgi:hypothetical protein